MVEQDMRPLGVADHPRRSAEGCVDLVDPRTCGVHHRAGAEVPGLAGRIAKRHAFAIRADQRGMVQGDRGRTGSTAADKRKFIQLGQHTIDERAIHHQSLRTAENSPSKGGTCATTFALHAPRFRSNHLGFSGRGEIPHRRYTVNSREPASAFRREGSADQVRCLSRRS